MAEDSNVQGNEDVQKDDIGQNRQNGVAKMKTNVEVPEHSDNLDLPLTPDSAYNDSGIDKTDVKSESISSTASLSTNGEVSIDMVVTSPSLPHTSTPMCDNTRKSNVRFEVDSRHDSVASFISDVSNDMSVSLESRDILIPEEVRVPIIGYEVMEERAKFTVSMKRTGMRSSIKGKIKYYQGFRAYLVCLHL